MEAPEVPTEQLHEELHHHAEHAGAGERWVMGVALSSALIAGFAAVASLLAGMNANEAMVSQMRASDQWNYYQAKGVKANILSSKGDLLAALGKAAAPKDEQKLRSYKKEQEEIQERAADYQKESEEHLETHETLARSVTMFQVAIAVAAVSVLARRRAFWYVALCAAVIGLAFMGQGLFRMRSGAEKAARHAEEAKGGGETGAPGGAAAEKPTAGAETPPAVKPAE